jgi:CheY-like chemotaxis protein
MAKKILIIEDKQDLTALLKFILEQFGYKVLQAFDGKEALELLGKKENIPDIIVCDIMMPEMDGYTLITHLENSENTRNIPIIIMTGKGQTKELFQDKKNVYEFIEKPFEPEDFKKVIERVLDEYGKKHT